MTAVEWFIQNIPDLGKYIPFGVSMELHAKFQQALEMEKQQIIEAHGIKENHGFKNGKSWWEQKTGEQYYNETYKPST